MTDKPISPLCASARMIDDMTARRIKEKVQERLRAARQNLRGLSLGRSPDTATSEDLRRFQVHLRRSCRSALRPSTPPSPRCGGSFSNARDDRTARPRPSS